MAWPALAVLILDQISKWIVVQTLQVHEYVPVIQGFFALVHVRNRGMAFGLFNRPGMDVGFYLLVVASVAAGVVLILWMLRVKEENQRLMFGLSMILGGAVGNLADRVRFGEVIDFLDFHVGSLHWPAFNLADSAITVGTFWVALNLILPQRNTSTPSSGKQ